MKKKEELYKYFQNICSLKKSSFDQFLKITKLENFQSGEYFISPNTSQDKIGIIINGSVKSYFLTFEGKQHIKSFLSKNDVSAAFKSEELSYNPEIFVEAMEETTLLVFNYIELIKLSKTDIELKELIHKILEIEFIKNEIKEYNFCTKDINENFTLINKYLDEKGIKAKQQDIASYLGITSIAYSRIKKRNT